ncbi:MAG: ParB/RepB/Spo0J family partition protein [Rhizobiales bacterium]|nr:ParB/RepB/Spo0J family partition protein [Hyphomicrobiales bacterium]
MADEMPSRLGRGLAALIGDDAAFALGENSNQQGPVKGLREVPIEYLRAGQFQPRTRFREEDLTDLANSIREKGILQPIVVRPLEGEVNSYEIVAGERRWRAAQLAQLHQVPVIIRELTDAESLEIAIIENVQRADLNAVEEGAGYERLMAQFAYTQEAVAKLIGKSRSHVANTLRLLSLPEPVRSMLEDGRLSAGQARPLIGHPQAEKLAKDIVTKGMSAREAEALARKSTEAGGQGKVRSAGQSVLKDADTVALEKNISDQLGLKVSINFSAEKGGEVKIGYKTLEQLDEICRRLAGRGQKISG